MSTAIGNQKSETTNGANRRRHAGRVLWFDAHKGIGFISVAPSVKHALGIRMEQDIFVHSTAVQFDQRPLQPDDTVELIIVMVEKGPRAEDVTVTLRARQEKPHRD